MKDIVFHFYFLKINIYQVTKKMTKATISKEKKNVHLGSAKSQYVAWAC